MKKLLIGISTLFVISVLAACGGDSVATPTVTPNEEAPVETAAANTEVSVDNDVAKDAPDFSGEEFLLWLDNELFAEAIIPVLEEQFPGVSFDWQEMGNTESLTNLSLDGPAGSGPDILFFMHDRVHQAISERLVLPVGPDLFEMMDGRFHAAAVASVYDAETGFHFGIPMTTESVALFYNRDILDSFGFEPAESFEELIEQVVYMNNPANNEFHFRWIVGNGFRSHFSSTAHGFQLFGPNHNDANQVNLNSPEVVEALDWLQTLRQTVLDVPSADLDSDNTFGAFLDGEVAYIIDGPWNIVNLLEHGEFELGIKKIPTINGNRPITFSGNVIMAGSAFTTNPALTRAVMTFLSSDEGIQIAYDVRGTIPALIDGSSINGLADNALHMGILAQANYSHPMPIIPEMAFFWDAARDMYAAAWDLILTPEEAAEHAELAYESARALANQ